MKKQTDQHPTPHPQEKHNKQKTKQKWENGNQREVTYDIDYVE